MSRKVLQLSPRDLLIGRLAGLRVFGAGEIGGYGDSRDHCGRAFGGDGHGCGVENKGPLKAGDGMMEGYGGGEGEGEGSGSVGHRQGDGWGNGSFSWVGNWQ